MYIYTHVYTYMYIRFTYIYIYIYIRLMHETLQSFARRTRTLVHFCTRGTVPNRRIFDFRRTFEKVEPLRLLCPLFFLPTWIILYCKHLAPCVAPAWGGGGKQLFDLKQTIGIAVQGPCEFVSILAAVVSFYSNLAALCFRRRQELAKEPVARTKQTRGQIRINANNQQRHKTTFEEQGIRFEEWLNRTVSFHDFKSQNFKLSVSNPKSKYAAYLSVLSRISNRQSLGRKNKHYRIEQTFILSNNKFWKLTVSNRVKASFGYFSYLLLPPSRARLRASAHLLCAKIRSVREANRHLLIPFTSAPPFASAPFALFLGWRADPKPGTLSLQKPDTSRKDDHPSALYATYLK